jgi:hypothetical protein
MVAFFSSQFPNIKFSVQVIILASPDAFYTTKISCDDLKVSEHFKAKYSASKPLCRDPIDMILRSQKKKKSCILALVLRTAAITSSVSLYLHSSCNET